MLPLKIPLYREPGEYDPELYASWERILEEMAAKDPAYQPALDAWREETAKFEAWERENAAQSQARVEAETANMANVPPSPRAKTKGARRAKRLAPAKKRVAGC